MTWPLAEGVGHSGPITHEGLAGFFGGSAVVSFGKQVGLVSNTPATGSGQASSVAERTPLVAGPPTVGEARRAPVLETASQRKRRRLSMVEADPAREL